MPKSVIVVTGPYGLVGRALFDVFPGLVPLDIVPLPDDLRSRVGQDMNIGPVDITDPSLIRKSIEVLGRHHGHLVVIHLAALTDTRSQDDEPFERVNVRGTQNIMQETLSVGGYFIHISTDYVFMAEDRAGRPYLETDRPLVMPSTPYAASKLRAENIVLDGPTSDRCAVVRISFPYGGAGARLGLAEKLIQRFQEHRIKKQPVRLFDDQFICPTYIPDIAHGLLSLVDRILSQDTLTSRVYHLTGHKTTPFEFGKTIRRVFGFEDVQLEPSSVKGTVYAKNLWMSHAATCRELKWKATPHDKVLKEFKNRFFN